MRHRLTKTCLAALFAALLPLAAACAPTVTTAERETVPLATQVPAIASATPPIQGETTAVSPSPSPEPAVTPSAPPPQETSGDEAPAVPTEVAQEKADTAREAEHAIAAATADLAQRLGVTPDDVLVRSVAPVLWPDASLGCPEPDVMYAQVQTPGYVIMLEVEGKGYRYHTDRSDQAVLCPEAPSEELPLIPLEPGEIDDGIPWMPVD